MIPNLSNYKWLLFDADNTLLDFTSASKKAFTKALKIMDIPNEDSLFSMYKKANRVVWTAFEKGEMDTITLRYKRFELFLDAIQLKRDPKLFSTTYLDNLVEHSELLDGAQKLLDRIHGQFKIGLITNGLKEVQRPRLAHTNTTKYFDIVVVSDEIGVAKPNSGFFDIAFQEMGFPAKKDVLVIGDNIHSDILGGIEYQVDTCWFNPSKQPNATSIKPTFEIHQLSQLT